MTITPGTPDDWTDTVEPKRAEAFVEYRSRDIGYNLRHYASPHASHRMGEGCQCRPSRIPHVGLAAPESARPATLTVEQPVKAPVEGENSQRPSEPVLPRQIAPGDYEVERVAATIHAAVAAAQAINVEAVYRSTGLNLSGGSHDFANIAWDAARAVVRDFDVRLVEDAPEPVDSDAEATDADTEDAVYLSGPMTGLPDFNRPAFHAAAAALRAQGYVVINPAEVDLGLAATWVDYMRIHLAEIARRVTQVFVLPGWESSRGAQLEVHVARSLGLPVVPAPEPVDPDAELVERMAKAINAEPGFNVSDMAYAALSALRETHDVTPRAEQ